jgi:hypothetical protein
VPRSKVAVLVEYFGTKVPLTFPAVVTPYDARKIVQLFYSGGELLPEGRMVADWTTNAPEDLLGSIDVLF